MSLAANNPIGFIPTANSKAAREFYEHTLGLPFESADDFAVVFRVGSAKTMLRVTTTPGFTPTQFTIFGWQVDDIQSAVADLTAKGIEFLRFGFLEQDSHGIWNAPGGTRVAWFKDPDGNTLSLSQHPA
jgi:predicted enzyme related to lactoylglutathione lyase